MLIQPWHDLFATFLSLQVTTKSKTTSAVLRSCEVFCLNKQTKNRPSHVAQRAKSSISRQCCCLRYALCHCASASTVSQFNLWDSSLYWIQARIFSPILIYPYTVTPRTMHHERVWVKVVLTSEINTPWCLQYMILCHRAISRHTKNRRSPYHHGAAKQCFINIFWWHLRNDC